jgi:hypothetical protein
MKDSRVVLGIGMLLSLLSNFLGCWVELAPNDKAEAAVQQQMAQHAAGKQARWARVGKVATAAVAYVEGCPWCDDRLWQALAPGAAGGTLWWNRVQKRGWRQGRLIIMILSSCRTN